MAYSRTASSRTSSTRPLQSKVRTPTVTTSSRSRTAGKTSSRTSSDVYSAHGSKQVSPDPKSPSAGREVSTGGSTAAGGLPRKEQSSDLRPTPAGSGVLRACFAPCHYTHVFVCSCLAVLIFDWDDTLLCSSWLAARNLRLDEPEVVPAAVRTQLESLEEAAINALEKAKAYGTVLIITNAEAGWVELSAQKFMPRVVPYLRDLRIISARTEFEPSWPDSPVDWKVQSFMKEVGNFVDRVDVKEHKNILSFGDSIHERTAVQHATKRLTDHSCKSIKFVERPTVDQLTRQLDLIVAWMDDIALHRGNLDLMLTIQLLSE